MQLSSRGPGRVFPFNRETRAYLDDALHKPEPLKAGDVFRDIEGRYHFVQYTNTSGAYAVPLNGVTRDRRTISLHSMVVRVSPLAMGGNSQEYRRYVKMVATLKEGGMAKRKVNTGPDAQGATFGDFDDSEIPESESATAGGQAVGGESDTPTGEQPMAKAKKAKAAKREKAPKTVRRCACGCGGETTGFFVPGHDARMHGWIKKLADGRITPDGKDAKSKEKVIPANVLSALGVHGNGKVKNPHFWDAEK